ncbi:DinB family protein [Streptomyces sp. NPDC056653]|uniref:DinB family protein n=1 Tax=Streptomyces sp. NPDC056653 TaxID=3345894 RepID=UPI0036946E87
MLRAYLEHQRTTLALKCEGLSEEQLRRQSVPPSTLSLMGLVRHMAEVERAWFRRIVSEEDIPLVWSDRGDFQVAYDVSEATWPEALAAWQGEIEHARRVERDAKSLDVTGYMAKTDSAVSLRRAMIHLIDEYARHNGHADLLREAIDGAVGY